MREGRRGREGARKGAAGRGAAAAAGPGGRAPRARGASGCPGPRGGGGQMLGPEQNTRAGGARGGCGGRTGPLASCALGGCPSPQPRPCPLPRRPQLFSRKINRLEGPPADKACVYAASSLVTGVAWQRARRGAAGPHLGRGAPQAPGLGCRGGRAQGRPSSSPFKLPPTFTLRGVRGVRSRRGAGWAAGGGQRAAGPGGGGERGNAKSRGLQGAGATSPRADPMRAAAPGMGIFPRRPVDPSPKGRRQGLPALWD